MTLDKATEIRSLRNEIWAKRNDPVAMRNIEGFAHKGNPNLPKLGELIADSLADKAIDPPPATIDPNDAIASIPAEPALRGGRSGDAGALGNLSEQDLVNLLTELIA
jgi:hypothetical protein